MNYKPSQPALEVGQVWSFDGRHIAIIGLGKHLAEYRQCLEGKVVSIGLSGMKSIRTVRAELVSARARLTGYVVITDRFVRIGRPRSPARR
jgi:hypothetical protein